MSSYTDVDSDRDRLPAGFTRTGYDSDTETYHYTDNEGRSWSGLPGHRYGKLYPSGSAEYHAALRGGRNYEEETGEEYEYKRLKFWQRQDGRGLLTFLLIAFVYLLFVLRYTLSGDGNNSKSVKVECGDGEIRRAVHSGDTCWAVGQEFGVDVLQLKGGYMSEGSLMNERLILDCDTLGVGDVICVSLADNDDQK